MASTKLTRTFGSGGSRVKWTWSGWIKRAKLGVEQIIFCAYENSNNQTQCKFDSSDQLYFNDESSANTNGRIVSTAKYRDPNAWYHMVFVWDKNNSTSTDRIKMYVNGERVTSFSDTGNWPSDTSAMNNDSLGREHEIGVKNGSNDYFDGCMSHIHFCDGYAYQASDFGSTDATTGEWKINTSPSVSYGTTGYFILKDGITVTDSSPNSNTWTVGGTLTKTEDCPSNVFCTMSPLDKSSSLNLNYGNLRTASPSNAWMPCKATIGMMGQNGKFYWEGKCQSGTYHYFGVYDAEGTVRGSVQSEMDSNRFVYTYAGSIERTITGQSAHGSGTYATFANNDIIGVGLDKENGTITFWKNGTQIYTETHSSLQTKHLIPGTQAYGSDILWNFGNGYFGTTAVASAGTNASANGIFEYDVPSGYTALSTKGLNL